MRASTNLGTWVGLAMLLGALGVACGGNGTSQTGGIAGAGGATSTGTHTTTSSSSSGTTSSTGTGGAGTGGAGAGGAGGGTAAGPNGPPATQLVSAGDVCTSPGYKMIFTLGQPTQNQSRTTSPSYQMQGGLIGANGSLP
jgi:hypothetical protein